LAAPERLWADLAPWGERGESFIAEPGDGRVPASLRSATAGGMLCVPIRFEGEALGALCADDGGRPLALDAQDLALANVLGAGVGIGMANARLHCQVTAASEEKSTFLARIAHELRNPLHTIIWDLDSLRAEAQSPHASLERLRQNALLMVTAAEELQQFSEVETHRVTPQPTTVDLVSLLDGVRATAAALLDDRPISLAVTVASDVGLIRSDPLRLRQILGNLLANAAKYTERGAIAVEVFRVGASVTIEVSDTGVGITPEEQESIFRPFYRGSTGAIVSARGMGLGLSIAQELAVLLGGRIAVESVAGVGSTFRFVLPALRVTPALGAPSGTADDLESDAAAAPAEAPAGSAPPEALLAGRVVLLIEDDPMERVRAAALARHCGARVIQATDGFEGLRRAREHRPDIIVLDLGLPGLSGVDVLGRLLRDPQLTGVNVLVATGHVDARLELHCRTVGCAGYLVKPYSREDLLGALARGAASGVRRMQASAG
jgi:signal transduction histidine kinase/ActR/RegA family two-component response regulator